MISIAIIEDDEDIRESLKVIVQTVPGFYCSGTFADAESGKEYLTDHPVDIVLMDIHLHGMDGIECIRQLKSIHPEMHFIMCTIFRDDYAVFNALKAGATGYLLKNEDPAKIAETIFEIHDGGSPMTPQIARRVLESFKKSACQKEVHLLTRPETELLKLIAKGLKNKEIADKLLIYTETIMKQIHDIYLKLHVQSHLAAVNKIYEMR